MICILLSLQHISNSIKKLSKFVNFDLKNLSNWLNANKISLNVSKTELIMFKPRIKKVDFGLKLKLNQKRIAYSYYRRKASKLYVLNVEMLIQTLFSIGMK